MAHEKFRNTLTFTDQFGPLLKLSTQQAKAIDDLDYECMKSYVFGLPPFVNERVARLSYLRKVAEILTPAQRRRLKEHRQKAKAQRLEEEERWAKAEIEALRRQYKSLKLSAEQMDSFIRIVSGSREEAFAMSRETNGRTFDPEEEFARIAGQRLRELLNQTQLKKFAALLERQRLSDWKWRVKITISNYEELELAYEQAEEVARFELAAPYVDEDDQFLSFEEEKSRQKAMMQAILSERQFESYLQRLAAEKADHVLDLKRAHLRKQQDVHAAIQALEYEETHVLPAMVALRKELDGHLTREEAQELRQIRMEYLDALDQDLARFERGSSRYNGPYNNEYVEQQWRSALQAMVPSSSLLKNTPAISVLGSLVRKYNSRLDAMLDKLEPVYRSRQEFTIRNHEEHGFVYGGFIHVIRPDQAEAELYGKASLLLLSPDLETNLEESRKRQPK